MTASEPNNPASPSSPGPSEACPKCGHRRSPDGTSCVRCGLVFALWKPESAARPVELDGEGQDLWRKVEEQWDDSTRHDAFVKHCLQRSLLPAAGRLYRARLDKSPGDPIATRMQADIVAKASLTMAMAQQHRVPAEPFTRSKWFWTVVLTAMALAIAAAFIWRPKGEATNRPIPALQHMR